MLREWSTRTLVVVAVLNLLVAFATIGAVAWWAGALTNQSSGNVSVPAPCDEPQPTPRPDGEWEGEHTKHASVIEDNGTYYLFYHAGKETELGRSIGVATTNNATLTGWERYAGKPVLKPRCGEWDDEVVGHPEVIEVPNATSGYRYHMFYFGGIDGGWEIGHAMSNDLLNWTRDPASPVLLHGNSSTWDANRVESPSVVRTDDGFAMLYHGTGNGNGFRIGLATSDNTNLSTWERHPDNPVLGPREPYEGDNVHGAAFQKRLGADDDHSGAIPERRNGSYVIHYAPAGRTVAAAATSDDLVNWERAEENPLWSNESGQFDRVSDVNVYNVSGTFHAFMRANENGQWTMTHSVFRNTTGSESYGEQRPVWQVIDQFPPVGREPSVNSGSTPGTTENQSAVP